MDGKVRKHSKYERMLKHPEWERESPQPIEVKQMEYKEVWSAICEHALDHLLTQGMQVATNNKYKGRKAYLQQTIKQQTKKTYIG